MDVKPPIDSSSRRRTAVHFKQLLTYLRLMRLPLGLLISFGAGTIKEGIKRVANNHHDFAASRLRVNQDCGDVV